ncbi:MAG TPA: serine/threonine-protein kinase, partial [Verrucomicrobiae bacterium]|nr:serine/threonine-protein kinase [Verrucomicrobiae bacterium]
QSSDVRMAIESNTSEGTAEHGQPGQFGPYYLHELINTGGMADLWIATDAAGKTCAITRMHPRGFFDSMRKRFTNGCEILSHLHDHELVIGYLGHGKIDGCLYLAMEYLESSNLKQAIALGDERLSELAGNILIDCATVLEYVHENGYMHLDFKPENVLLTRSGNIRLVDFDLAQERPEEPRKLPKNPGTPAYMAPEQILRQPVDHRVDIFAFGVAAYELLTFEKPFPGGSPDEVLKAQLDRTAFMKPREHNPAIPVRLEQIVLKCLETLPDQRYPFTSVLLRDLQAALYV